MIQKQVIMILNNNKKYKNINYLNHKKNINYIINKLIIIIKLNNYNINLIKIEIYNKKYIKISNKKIY